MSLGNIQERIRKMKDAIKNEAKQRAQTILERAQEEADIERNKIIDAEKQKIDHEFYLKIKAEGVKAKIEKSTLVNRERLRKMKSRFELIEELKRDVEERLIKYIKDDKKYKQLLEKLLVQSMIKLMERNASIRIKSDQIHTVEAVLKKSQQHFTEILSESGKSIQSILEVSSYRLEDQRKNIIGGVYLTSNDGKIVCNNTINSRIDMAFEQMLPFIRNVLFQKS